MLHLSMEDTQGSTSKCTAVFFSLSRGQSYPCKVRLMPQPSLSLRHLGLDFSQYVPVFRDWKSIAIFLIICTLGIVVLISVMIENNCDCCLY